MALLLASLVISALAVAGVGGASIVIGINKGDISTPSTGSMHRSTSIHLTTVDFFT